MVGGGGEWGLILERDGDDEKRKDIENDRDYKEGLLNRPISQLYPLQYSRCGGGGWCSSEMVMGLLRCGVRW